MIFISYCNENDNSHTIFTNLPTCFLRIQNVFFLFKHWNIGENVKMEKLVEKWENAKMTKLDYTIGTQFCSIQKQPQKVLYKKGVLKNFTKFTVKHLRLWHR